MTVVRWAAGVMLLVLAGCGGSDSETATPTVMPDVVGRQLDAALSDIKGAGIDDEVEVTGGGTFGVVNESNWQVCDQAPAAGAPVTAAPQLTVDRSCDDGSEEATTSLTEAEADEVLTSETSPELAALLGERDECSDTIMSFASTYRGRTVEFDGHIGALANHAETDSRYDILILPGDAPAVIGPQFQFRDVSMADLHLSGTDVPDSVRQGDNLRVTARVEEYERESCQLLLDPVSTAVR